MKINKIELINFRCFEKYEIEFSDRFTLLIGDNGSGKTAILDALAYSTNTFLEGFPDYINSEEQRYIPNQDDIHYELVGLGQGFVRERIASALLTISGIMEDTAVSWSFSIMTPTPVISSDSIVSIRLIASRLFDNITKNQTLLPVIRHYGTGRLWKKLDNIEIETLPIGSRLLGYRNCLNSASNLGQLFRWFKTQEVIALQKRERRHSLEAVRTAIIEMIPDATSVIWNFEWDQLQINTNIHGKTQEIPFHLLSDGYRNMIGMAADIAYRMATLNPQLEADVIKQTEGIVLIDEIDLHLHPKWQREVVGRLLKTFPKVQFVASSHSPFIIQSLYHRNDVLLWDLDKAEPVSINSKSIEDIAEDQQGVEIPQQSQRFLDMKEAAEEYYSLLKQLLPASEEEKQHLKQKLDELLLPYSDDPAFQAFLKMERLTVEGQENQQ